DLQQAAEKIPHLGLVHEPAIFIMGTIAGPNLGSALDIFQRDENNVGIDAKLTDRGILEMGLYAVHFPRREICSTDVAAKILAIKISVGFGLFPGALWYRSEIMIAHDRVFEGHQPAAQLADHLPLSNRNHGK